MIRVTVWNENVHERQEGIREAMKPYHPAGIHGTIAQIIEELGPDAVEVRTAVLDQPEQGLPQSLINQTDVLVWWGHAAHDAVSDELADRIQKRILSGMGLIVLHSGHYSKIFRRMMGTTCDLRWRDNTFERVFTIAPNHPIAKGIPPYFDLGTEECYGERFDIPRPDEVIFEGWFDIGEVFRSGCVWNRGYGKIFYFQPGHETNGSFQNPYVRRILQNAVEWIAPAVYRDQMGSPMIDPTLEALRTR